MELAGPVVFVGLLVFLAHAFVALFERTRVPDVLWLITLGLLLGPVLGVVEASDFGAAGRVFTAVALVVFLFEGGFKLSFARMATTWKETLALTVILYCVTFVLLAAFLHSLTPLGLHQSLFCAAVLAGPAPSLMAPAIRHLRLGDYAKGFLRVETPFGEALSFVVALGILRAFRTPDIHVGVIIGSLASAFVLAAVIGAVSAYLWSLAIHRVRQLSQGVFLTHSFLLVLFGAMELIGFSGPIAVLVFGIVLGNISSIVIPWIERRTNMTPLPQSDLEKQFMGEVTFIVKAFFFAYIGTTIHFTYGTAVAVAFSVTGILMLVRLTVLYMPAVLRRMSSQDAMRTSVMIPKGTAAAVLASMPLQQSVVGGLMMQDITYGVITMSVFISTALMLLITRRTTPVEEDTVSRDVVA